MDSNNMLPVRLREARLQLNLSQQELADRAGINVRTITRYELGTMQPRQKTLETLAEILRVTPEYLLGQDNQEDILLTAFISEAKDKFGSKGKQEATDLIEKTGALFAGGTLDDEAKDLFMDSITQIYLASKQEASQKFSPKGRKKKAKW